MFGGVLAILIAIWVFRTAVQAKTGNVILWTAGAAILFFVVQMLFYNINIFIIDGFGNDVGGDYERDLTDIGDRITSSGGSGGIQEGFFGTVLGILFELLPLFMAWLTVAFIRTKYILKEEINVKNLTSGISGMFVDIKNSFKSSE
ncbi:conserved hypothetical protein [Bathymodiolus platifrons methanotrophic gill symbiont]|uniref:hypothetical protein n=1 Tax=Bathymodiolus platifrons methanotrophic gill symbiont TaxID=113268 RepID=UPI000B412EFD|nr:hypothetical protein [Bathymodiolus platifrons methanotrophic gill symbiont]MCK5869753.1 hypothetical protein [Methyloprofundus sp.]TXK94346.1 hypothetical protein BMR10_13425 [Methylococcaceae bacterium CS4]TXK98538.1 hypothetical protein BMR11_08220 [Methylococcaceae bacterium CS5]TXL04360.1 hypothetical protein BMR07_12665 [Methylococcaceae bacterium CS1]TXL09493.1 hypothetical protein BMR09_00200 [Methylococcaceae bacterium CS3]TXL10728.1 hypothetical protein BMR08_07695 [Methylococcac